MLNINVRNWDQYSINKYVCLKHGNGIPVGCAAVATAQIMSYFMWPIRWPIKGFELATEKYTFNWKEMIKSNPNDRVARLVEILGRPEYLSINYDKDGSGTSDAMICPTFNKMGYKRTAYIPYHTEQALNTLYKKSPILMTGERVTDSTIGHAWTVDGLAQYRVSPVSMLYFFYYHIVWGNGGNHNGYFYYDEATKSFSEYAVEFDEEDNGYEKYDKSYGDLGDRWKNVKMVIDFEVDTSLLN